MKLQLQKKNEISIFKPEPSKRFPIFNNFSLCYSTCTPVIDFFDNRIRFKMKLKFFKNYRLYMLFLNTSTNFEGQHKFYGC